MAATCFGEESLALTSGVYLDQIPAIEQDFKSETVWRSECLLTASGDINKQDHIKQESRLHPCALGNMSVSIESSVVQHQDTPCSGISLSSAVSREDDTLPKTDSQEGPFRCRSCGETFSHQAELLSHRLIHLNVDSIKCTVCSKAFRTAEDLQQHQQIHEKNPFVCDVCGELFKTRRSLLKHQRASHSREGKDSFSVSKKQKGAHICGYCSKTFKNRGHLVEHIRIHTNEKPFDCSMCGKAFSRQGNLRKHMATHTKDKRTFPCMKCGHSFATCYLLKKHRRLHRDRPHMCDLCKKMFAAKGDLQKHLQLHKKEDYICDMCNKKFKTYLQLTKHKEKHRAALRHHICTTCSKSFKTASNLHKHQRLHVHAANTVAGKQHVCKFCQKGFKKLTGLNLHMRTHAKAKAMGQPARSSQGQDSTSMPRNKYFCGICSNSFETYYRMRKHKQMHRDRPFMCDTCEETFVAGEDLHKHKQSDCTDSYICEVCSKIFSTEETLQRHKIKHILKRPFLCGVCLKSFKTTGELKTHMLSHLDQKPHKCQVCDKGFTEIRHLQKHQNLCRTGASTKEIPSFRFANDRVSNDTAPDQTAPQSGIDKELDGRGKKRKRFECSFCGKILRHSSNLKEHERVHSNERPFSCNECGRAFKQQSALKLHRLRHKKAQLQMPLGLKKKQFKRSISDGSEVQSQQQKNPSDRNDLTSSVTADTVSTCNLATVLQVASDLAIPANPNPTVGVFLSQHAFDSCSQSEPSISQPGLTGSSSNGNFEAHNEGQQNTRGSFVCGICNKILSDGRGLEMHRSTHHVIQSSTSSIFGEALHTLYSGVNQSSVDCHQSTVGASTAPGHCSNEISLGAHHNAGTEPSDSDDDFGPPDLTNELDEVVEMSCTNILKSPEDIHRELAPLPNIASPPASTCSGSQLSGQTDSFIIINRPFPCGKRFQLVLDKMQFFTCDVCNKDFPTNAELDSHKMTHIEKLPDSEGAQRSRLRTAPPEKAVDKVQVSSSAKSFPCRYCPKVCTNRSRLLEHERVHTKEKPYKCSECSRTFSHGSSLRGHLIGVHKKEFPKKTKRDLKCTICKKDFKVLSDLARHLKVHSMERPFKCDRCSKAYKQKSHLKFHKAKCVGESISESVIFSESSGASKISQHCASSIREVAAGGMSHMVSQTSTSRPLKCNICSKAFRYPYEFQRHKLTHSKEKSFNCNRCKRAYKQKYLLKKHWMDKHASPKLTSANRVTVSTGSLVLDVETHNNAELNKCDNCGKAYKHKKHLKAHGCSRKAKPSSSQSNKVPGEGAAEINAHHKSRHKLQEQHWLRIRRRDSHTGRRITNELFQCSICRNVFKDKHELATHSNTCNHSEKGTHKCDSCNRIYRQKHHLKAHQKGCTRSFKVRDELLQTAKLSETDEVPQENSPCTVPLGGDNATEDVPGTENQFPCHICGEICMCNSKSQEDTPVHTQEKSFHCVSCDQSFPSKSSLETHKLSFHGQKSPGSRNQRTNELHKCSICDKSFPRKSRLAAHKSAHSKERPYKCDRCDRAYKHKHHLKEHQKRCSKSASAHHDYVGGQVWPNKAELQAHLESHNNERKYKCGTCNRAYKQKHHLKDHQRKTSCPLTSGEPQREYNHECSICQKVWPSKALLKKHQRSHNTDKPFKCGTCNRAYKHKHHLREHQKKTFCELTGGQPQKRVKDRARECEICQKNFKYPYELERHRSVHSKERTYKCDKCDRAYKQSYLLKKHCADYHASDMAPIKKKVAKVKISGWKAHPCSLCGRKFQSTSQLWLHRKVHPLNGRLFGCVQCGKMCRTAKCLRAHQLRRHKDSGHSECGGLQHVQHEEMGQNKAAMTKGQCPVAADEGNSALELLQTMQPDLEIEQTDVQDAPTVKISQFSEQCTEMSMPENVNLAERHTSPLNPEQAVVPVTSYNANTVGSLSAGVRDIHKCVLCQEVFPSIRVLKKHRMSHQEQQFCCGVCGRIYLTAGHLQMHHTQAHADIKDFKCRFCGQEFCQRSDSIQHEKTHTTRPPVSCDLCGRKFKEYLLQRHKELHHPGVEAIQIDPGQDLHSSSGDDMQSLQPLQAHSCSSCSEKCDSGLSLLRHLMSVHREEEPLGQAKSSETHKPADHKKQQHRQRHKDESKLVSCDSCGKYFKAKQSLHRHKLMFHAGQQCLQIQKPAFKRANKKCEQCGLDFCTRRLMIKHFTTLHANHGSYWCEYCTLPFSSYWRLRTHKHLMHSLWRTKLFPCRICKKEFCTPRLLHCHSRIHFKRRTCTVCSKIFETVHQLAAHKRSHSEGKTFMCDVCGKLYSSFTYLKDHQAIHSNERPFICEHCGKRYRSKSTLKHHKRTRCYENKEGVCNICGRYFPNKRWLPVHMRSHRDKRRTCQVCNKVFKKQKFLTVHMRSHTNTRLYPCKFCSKSFITRTVQRSHMNIHLGQRPYKCKSCEACFASSGSLYNHQRVHKKQRTTAGPATRKAKRKSKCSVKE